MLSGRLPIQKPYEEARVHDFPVAYLLYPRPSLGLRSFTPRFSSSVLADIGNKQPLPHSLCQVQSLQWAQLMARFSVYFC